ncbi:MAG: HPr-rel-A system PqqD family peptide chaperone [Methylophilaceae bacterium]|nr:HPr-rel-A system PqqD family peptide chaperone [Methylophilaceae bacterium]
MSTRWHATTGGSLHWRAWDDEMVIYNNTSGDTHLLGVDAAQILLLFEQAPADLGIVSEQFATGFPAETHEESTLQIEQILLQLHELALIEIC